MPKVKEHKSALSPKPKLQKAPKVVKLCGCYGKWSCTKCSALPCGCIPLGGGKYNRAPGCPLHLAKYDSVSVKITGGGSGLGGGGLGLGGGLAGGGGGAGGLADGGLDGGGLDGGGLDGEGLDGEGLDGEGLDGGGLDGGDLIGLAFPSLHPLQRVSSTDSYVLMRASNAAGALNPSTRTCSGDLPNLAAASATATATATAPASSSGPLPRTFSMDRTASASSDASFNIRL